MPAGIIVFGQVFPIGLDGFENIHIDAAFHDLVLVRVVRHIDRRNLTRFQEEDIIVTFGFPDRCIVIGKFNRAAGTLISDSRVIFILGELLINFPSGAVSCQIPDLVRKFHETVVNIIGPGNLLGQCYLSRLHRGQVKTHVKVGGACSALHIIDLHMMCGKVPENSFSFVKKLIEIGFYLSVVCLGISRPVIGFKNTAKGRRSVSALYFTRSEIDGTAHGLMDAAQIQNQLIINIKPEIIVSGKLKDNIMAPCIQSVSCLGKVCRHFHTEKVVGLGFWNFMEAFAVTRVIFRKTIGSDIGRIPVYL